MNGPLPLWVDVLTAAMVLAGAVAALVGSFGLLRLRDFFARVHAPTLGYTLGSWGFAAATALQFTFTRDQFFAHALLVVIFIALTAPVTTIFIMRAAIFRRRLARDRSVPAFDPTPRRRAPSAPRG